MATTMQAIDAHRAIALHEVSDLVDLKRRRRQYRARVLAAAPGRTPRPLPESVDCCVCTRRFRPGADWPHATTCGECVAPIDAVALLATAEAEGRFDVGRSDAAYARVKGGRAGLDDD
jgi:hypothetical protein